jgi:hypothetical protein
VGGGDKGNAASLAGSNFRGAGNQSYEEQLLTSQSAYRQPGRQGEQGQGQGQGQGQSGQYSQQQQQQHQQRGGFDGSSSRYSGPGLGSDTTAAQSGDYFAGDVRFSGGIDHGGIVSGIGSGGSGSGIGAGRDMMAASQQPSRNMAAPVQSPGGGGRFGSSNQQPTGGFSSNYPQQQQQQQQHLQQQQQQQSQFSHNRGGSFSQQNESMVAGAGAGRASNKWSPSDQQTLPQLDPNSIVAALQLHQVAASGTYLNMRV